MTGEDDTRQPARLSLAERAKRGLLADELELELEDILELEYPRADFRIKKSWGRAVVNAIEFGMLPARRFNPLPYEPGDAVIFFGASTWVIARDSYRTWRATESNAPAGSFIHLWLGTAPAPSAPALPQGEPGKSESGAAAKHAALESLLAEIDKRAAEQGTGFDRHSLPGTKQEFHKMLNAYHPLFGYMNTQNLADEYLKGKCQFQRGAKPEQGKGKAIWKLFPEHDPK